MKTCYVINHEDHRPSIADLVAPGHLMPYWTITRINVPRERRGEGHGTVLLVSIIMDADAEGATLALEVRASDGLDNNQLELWYRRHGFMYNPSTGYMIRPPKAELMPDKLRRAVNQYIEDSEHEDPNWWIGSTMQGIVNDFVLWFDNGGFTSMNGKDR